jgi:hypothetical protein
MNLGELDLENFFPGSTITTRFGWDLDPPGPRIHHAIDRAGKGIVCLPFAAERMEWVDEDANGCSVLRAFADGGAFELRLLHFIKAELSPGILAAVQARQGLPSGQPIGPAGNKGLSVSLFGGDGRHVHYQLMLKPGIYDQELEHILPGWSIDRRDELARRYGPAFVRECATRGITWINEQALERADPWTGRQRIIIDSAGILGL